MDDKTVCAKFDFNASQTGPACGVPLPLCWKACPDFVSPGPAARGASLHRDQRILAMSGHWIAVASAEHVRRGKREGFMQVSHGKAAPLKRIRPGDRVVYYSPTITLGGKDRLQAFTAIGAVKEGEPYVFDMGNGFKPTAAMSRGQKPTKRPFIRCSTGWSSPPGSRIGVIRCASDFFRSAPRISA
jgi:hypothetical protein